MLFTKHFPETGLKFRKNYTVNCSFFQIFGFYFSKNFCENFDQDLIRFIFFTNYIKKQILLFTYLNNTIIQMHSLFYQKIGKYRSEENLFLRHFYCNVTNNISSRALSLLISLITSFFSMIEETKDWFAKVLFLAFLSFGVFGTQCSCYLTFFPVLTCFHKKNVKV